MQNLTSKETQLERDQSSNSVQGERGGCRYAVGMIRSTIGLQWTMTTLLQLRGNATMISTHLWTSKIS
eukprot:scaffold45522_cov285-Skeletonema_marinoi.AAC.1